jgi:exosome complex component RRP42
MSAVKKSIVVETVRRTELMELLAEERRLDGRGLHDYREIEIETNVVQKAEGSAKVRIGNTEVIAGVKVQTGEPFPDTPDKGLLVVNAEVLPLASPYAEPGPPDEEAIELARVVDRGIRESQMIDVSKLVLVEGKHVYAVFADVSVLNVDGNLFDATSYAVVSALLTTRMTKYRVAGGDNHLEKTDERVPLPIRTTPVSITIGRIGDLLVVDPTSEEEAVMDARITLTTDSEGHLCAGQKGEPGSFTTEQIMEAANLSLSKGREIREKIAKVTSGV